MTPIADTRHRHRLADIAGRTAIPLAAAGGTVTVRCPFPAHGHPDRTPSLRLYLDHDRYYCFGCHSRGDVVQWARDAAGLDVHEAIELLDGRGSIRNAWAGHVPSQVARRHAGTAVDRAQPDRTPPNRVHAALCAAWKVYTSPDLHHRGYAYLRHRGIGVAALEEVTCRPEVGHTPPSRNGLVVSLAAGGFSADELVDAGLATRTGNGSLRDFYHRRTLLPVRDPQGRMCGFIGRATGNTGGPKYLNPPRTAVYDKSINLYQPLDPPRSSGGHVIVVEGTLDALAVAVSAIRFGLADRYCPITQSGKELSDHQLKFVLGLRPEPPLVAFDGDEAGWDATVRLGRRAAALGAAVRIARLPPGEDPASLLAAHGPSALCLLTPSRRASCLSGLTDGTAVASSSGVVSPSPAL